MGLEDQDAHQERRTNSDALLLLVQTVHGDLKALDAKMSTHMTDAISEVLHRAFPAGDPEGHRIAHEKAMQAISDRAEFWRKMLFEVSKYGLLGFLGWLVYVAWVGLLHGPQK